MSLAIVYSRGSHGIDAPLVTVETHIALGLPALSIVGLPETAVKESKDRVRSAITNSGFEFPMQKIIINLAPADLPKEGGRFDLPIAISILAASNQIDIQSLKYYELAGELALTGYLRPIKGALPFSLQTGQSNRKLILPFENANEAALCQDTTVFGANHLKAVCEHLTNKKQLPASQALNDFEKTKKNYPDLQDVVGQSHAKRALEIAAAGKHSL